MTASTFFVDRRCICYWCGTSLVNWEKSDRPRDEHSRHSPECQLLTMCGKQASDRHQRTSVKFSSSSSSCSSSPSSSSSLTSQSTQVSSASLSTSPPPPVSSSSLSSSSSTDACSSAKKQSTGHSRRSSTDVSMFQKSVPLFVSLTSNKCDV